MESTNLASYFKRLRMIYCREQQLIGLLPDLVSEAMHSRMKEAMASSLAAARCRRYMINDLAWDHGISPLGEECVAMKKLIAVGSARLATESRGARHDRAVDAFCLQLHRVVTVEYQLARSLALERNLHAAVGCLDEVIEALTDAWGRGKNQPRISRRLLSSTSPATR